MLMAMYEKSTKVFDIILDYFQVESLLQYILELWLTGHVWSGEQSDVEAKVHVDSTTLTLLGEYIHN